MKSRSNPHGHTADEERDIRESALDETIEDSFPASDPPSSVPNPDDHRAAARRKSGSRRGPITPVTKHRADST